MNGETLSLADLRSRLGGLGGQRYWRSLEELAGTEQFQDLLHREFPRQAGEWLDPVSRRGFLKLMAASLALAGVGGYVQPPEEMVPGKPLYFATACTLRGYAQGLLAESHMGRPTKVEGNPGHPLNGRGDGSSFGATDLYAQASVLGLYDPDRSQVVTHLGRIGTWDGFLAELGPVMDAHRTRGGAGLRILTQSVTSPTLAARLEQLLGALPNARWTVYEPFDRESVRAGSRQAFGADYETQYHLDKAKVVVALDADFLSTEPGSLRYAREFVDGRRVRKGHSEMNRLYVVESTPSITGGMADHRLPLRSVDIEAFGRALGRALVAKGLSAQGFEELLEPAPGGAGLEQHKAWLEAAASDLIGNQGAALVVPGEGQPPALHALAHALNSALGGVGKTVGYTRPVQASSATGGESLAALIEEIDAGQVTLLVILGGNPAYDAPADFRFAERIAKVPLRVHLGLYEDETSELCHWHLPESHELESWGDARAWDGTVSVLQPLIAPLYAGKSAHELLAALVGEPGKSSYELLREIWATGRTPEELERFWRRALHDGVVAGTALPPESPALSLQRPVEPPTAANPGLEVVFRPDPSVWDGRFSNNGWLQEMPRPLTKLTWDNAALLAPVTAEKLGVRNEDVVELRLQGRSVRAPVWILPGHAADSVTVHLGYGRRRTGRVGTGAGFDAYALRSSGAMGFATGLEVLRTPERSPLACTQDHHSMEGRDIVRSSPLAGLLAKLGGEAPAASGEHAEAAGGHGAPAGGHGEGHHPSLIPDFEYTGYAWGMSVDLNACTGCNACSMACVAENNTPVVGKDQVARGREMHWLRLDRYFGGSLDNPETLFQPMACQHCEKAPCEVVCPVAATVHSDEGLNDMVYNRCVGTRYCSNNCPYKVRRFNFLQYSDFATETLKLLRNPDVTVRSRGVMEKCTYCVQRINTARITAKKEDRKIRDGEIVAACQQACPTEAIVFGDINDPESRVAKLKTEPLGYLVLDELGVQPRTSYLGRAKNPNPDLASGGAG